jgi:hypothetical protein
MVVVNNAVERTHQEHPIFLGICRVAAVVDYSVNPL